MYHTTMNVISENEMRLDIRFVWDIEPIGPLSTRSTAKPWKLQFRATIHAQSPFH
jgi:hypothetical protein